MHIDTYITRLGTEFTFGFQKQGENYEVLILDQPGYGSRSDDAHITHRNTSGADRSICWTGAMPTLAEAKRIAGLWADLTENYILTGEPFPES